MEDCKCKRAEIERKHGKPCVVDGDKDGRDWVCPEELIPVGATGDEFSRRDFTLPIQKQGSTNTCVGQTAKICMQDTEDFRERPPLSPMYIYYWAQRHDEWAGENYQGTSNSGACKALYNKGNVLNADWPNPHLTPNRPIYELDKLAAKRKLKNYFKVEPWDAKFEEKAKGLLLNESLLCSFKISTYFFNIGSDGVVDSAKFEEAGIENLGHAVAITGWKIINGELHWEMQNSLGEEWGDSGRCYFPNSLFKKYTLGSVYYLVTQSEEQGPIPFEKGPSKARKTMMWVGIGFGILLIGGFILSKLI